MIATRQTERRTLQVTQFTSRTERRCAKHVALLNLPVDRGCVTTSTGASHILRLRASVLLNVAGDTQHTPTLFLHSTQQVHRTRSKSTSCAKISHPRTRTGTVPKILRLPRTTFESLGVLCHHWHEVFHAACVTFCVPDNVTGAAFVQGQRTRDKERRVASQTTSRRDALWPAQGRSARAWHPLVWTRRHKGTETQCTTHLVWTQSNLVSTKKKQQNTHHGSGKLWRTLHRCSAQYVQLHLRLSTVPCDAVYVLCWRPRQLPTHTVCANTHTTRASRS